MPVNRRKKITKRLLPLYYAAFFQGFVFWYTVEKLFMTSIGFDNSTIGMMIAVYSAVMLAFETPSGILADKWSRKGVLILASSALILASLIGGISNGIIDYLICASMWGVFFSMYSGTYNSIVYDTLYEETSSAENFEYYYGKTKIYDSLALVISSLLGGVIAELAGLRAAYFLTIPFVFMSIFALAKFREPKLHKQDVTIPIKQQINSTFAAVAKNRSIIPVVLVLILAGLLIYVVLEFSQLWYIALAAPVALFGPANAALLSCFGLGGALAGRIKLKNINTMAVILSLIAISTLGIIYLRNVYLIIFCLAAICTLNFTVNIFFERLLHDSLSSNIRAGASSAVSTASRALIIPISLVFGYISRETSIFSAAWIVLGLVILMISLVFYQAGKNNWRGLHPVKN